MNFPFRVKHKFNAKPSREDDIYFSSQLEKNYYLQLKLLVKAEQIRFFLCQVPFRLPGGVKYLVDFMIVNLDGSIEFHEVKGAMTPIAKLKLKQVEALYPIRIKIITKV